MKDHGEKMAINNLRNILAIILAVSLVNIYWINDTSIIVQADPSQDLIIGDDESVYVVAGDEEWRDILVIGGGKFVVPAGTTLNVSNIYLQSGSIFEATGGTITIINSSHAVDVHFNGTCAYFNVTNYSIIEMRGGDGYADTSSPGPYDTYIPISMGGDSGLNITATQGLQIEDSTITVTGGHGFNLPPSTSDACNAWGDGVDVDGYVAAGGNATLFLNLLVPDSEIFIDNSILNICGGDGGDAANGGAGTYSPAKGGKGGGYSNGGNVSGNVGCGGNVIIGIHSEDKINISRSDFTASGGNGGAGGNGGPPDSFAGGGGGGYGGGDGSNTVGMAGEDSGLILGRIGCGGEVNMNLSSPTLYLVTSEFSVKGGYGGRAGDGGKGYPRNGGGGGGGGYCGGGGGGYGSSSKAGDGGKGILNGSVGLGGSATFEISTNSYSLLKNVYILTEGGLGGDAGDGGDAMASGGGGGGFGGGGGGGNDWQYYAGGHGGSTNITGNVSLGGHAEIISYSQNTIEIIDTILNSTAGNGGDAGNGGNGYSPYSIGTLGSGGGGGGGYGGGGGGGSCGGYYEQSGHGGNGGNTTLVGNFGVGGIANVSVTSQVCTFDNSYVIVYGGDGGNVGLGGAAIKPQDGGGGGGGYGGGGGGAKTDNSSYGRGGNNTLNGSFGDGGESLLYICVPILKISPYTDFLVNTPSHGDNSTHRGDDVSLSTGGEGLGYNNSNGRITRSIPICIPFLISPQNNSYIRDTTPMLKYFAYGPTNNGWPESYTIQVDDDLNWENANIFEGDIGNVTEYTLPTLSETTYYWRVKANYSSPPGSSAGWSEIWTFTVSLLAPTNLSILVDYIGGEITLNWTRPQSPTLDHYLIYRSSDPHDFNFAIPYNNSLTWPDPLATSWSDPDINEGSNDFNYFYIVRGVNNTGYEEQNMNIVGKYVSWMNNGWNLVSIPLKQSNTSINQVLSTILGYFNIIYHYSRIDGKWHHSNGDFSNIDHKMGFWIHMKNSDKLITNGSVVNSVIHLTPGWNLVGYPSFVEKSVNNVFSNVPSFDAARCYNSADINDLWKNYKKSKSFGNDLATMKTGFGYWVYVKADSDWDVKS